MRLCEGAKAGRAAAMATTIIVAPEVPHGSRMHGEVFNAYP
jgi:hypothetical protein